MQVVEFFRSGPARRLMDQGQNRIPVRPEQPKIINVSGGWDMEPTPNNQMMDVTLASDPDDANVDNYRIIIVYDEIVTTNLSTEFRQKQKEIVTRSNEKDILLYGLSAGQYYRLAVAARNSQGEGLPSALSQRYLAGHIMVTIIHVSPSPGADSPGLLRPSWNDSPMWLERVVQVSSEDECSLVPGPPPFMLIDATLSPPNLWFWCGQIHGVDGPCPTPPAPTLC